MADSPFLLPILCAVLGAVAGVLAGRCLLRPSMADAAAPAEDDRQLAALRQELANARREAGSVRERADRQREELARAREHIHHLEQQAAAYLRQYAQAKDLLKKEILQNGSLRTELAAGSAEAQALRARIQELMMDRGGTARAQGHNA